MPSSPRPPRDFPFPASPPSLRALASLALALALFASTGASAGEGAQASAAPRDTMAHKGTDPSADLVVFNRKLATFRSTVLGVDPVDRASRGVTRIEELLARPGKHEVDVRSAPIGEIIAIDGHMAFVVAPGDLDPLAEEAVDVVARRSAAALAQVVAETRESRDMRALTRGLLASAVATGAFLLLAWALGRILRGVSRRVSAFASAHGGRLRLGNTEVVARDRIVVYVQKITKGAYWLLLAFMAYEWLGFVLGRFPYTRPWGERLVHFLEQVVSGLAGSVVQSIPGIVVAVLIFGIARAIVQGANSVFDRVAEGRLSIPWIDRDTVGPTKRIASAVIWIFAVAMAYPYLPGAQSEAFKGLSVLVGLMISLGATSVVGQAAGGLILMYTRTVRVGEYVRVNDVEGTVVDLGLFITRIRTGLGEEITLSNAVVVGATTRNYSRTMGGHGFVLDATVTIGYDAPWRQVEAMLLEAAHRTEGVVQDPPSKVFQTQLSDFYVEYRLVTCAMPRRPVPRAMALSALLGNIQDVFNEHGVQIMSPHYLGDPATAKIVPPAHWYAPPAKPPQGETGGGVS